jgi:hypothetical protein
MQETTLRTSEETRLILKNYLTGMDVEIVNEIEDGENWGFWTKFGSFPVLIEHKADSHYCVVAFQITLPEDGGIAKLNSFYQNNDAIFLYELTRAFSSPLTGFTRIVDNDRVIGYSISKYIYPFHPEFSMRSLDIALQAVISTGAVGAAFLRAMLKEGEVRHEMRNDLKEAQTGPMFG